MPGLSNLSEMKDTICRNVSCVHTVLLISAVAGFVTGQQCVIPCAGDHVEHTAVIKDVQLFCLLFAYLFFDLCTSAPAIVIVCFFVFFSYVKKFP